MTHVMDNVPLGQSHYDMCYGQWATGRVIMTLIVDNVPQGQSHFDTYCEQCATGTESL